MCISLSLSLSLKGERFFWREEEEEKIKKERRTLNKTPLLESVGFSMNNFYRGTFVCVCVFTYVGMYVVLPKNSKKIRL